MHWDVFCRVIDNFGDVGVSWRLCANLAERGETVRLWIDDVSALAWMAPSGMPGVQVLPWGAAPPDLAPQDVAVETYGCDAPPGFVQRMDARTVWINLEYLSAESYVERSHGLPSPQPGGLVKWFFYPGFTPRTGGLLREAGLAGQQAAFDRAAWLDANATPLFAGERAVSLFAYAGAPFHELFDRLDTGPTLLLLCAGASQATALQRLHARPRRHLRAHALPWLSQPAYDRLLWSCDLNLARGEDSIVRSMWAGAPFIWQIYPQHDGVHAGKLEALLARMSAAPAVRALWHAWNGLGAWPDALPPAAPWRAHCAAWRDALWAQTDLAGQLLGFVATKRGGPG